MPSIIARGRTVIAKWLAPISSAMVGRAGNWWGVIRESFTGAWQRNIEVSAEDALSTPTVYACCTRISNDIGKLRQRLVVQSDGGIWSEVEAQSPYWFVLKRPNRYQNQIQFKQWWIMSKLTAGNTYALKERDSLGVVKGLHVLAPRWVTPLVTDDGSIYYELSQDNLSGIKERIVVPASEIIHDRMNCLYHPLVGVSPLYAAAIAAGIGISIQRNVLEFFKNGAMPSGIIIAPGNLDAAKAKELAQQWQSGFTGENSGKVAVLADGLKYEAMSHKAVDSQLIQTLGWSDERVCSVFHVPAYKVGVGPLPNQNNVGAMQQQYYNDCLQVLIEEYEAALDDGFGIANTLIGGKQLGVELDLDGLMRMDPGALLALVADGVTKSILTTDEARRRLNLGKVDGGSTIWRQQQYYSLAALDARDRNDPFAKPVAPTAANDEPPPDDEDGDGQEQAEDGFEEAAA